MGHDVTQRRKKKKKSFKHRSGQKFCMACAAKMKDSDRKCRKCGRNGGGFVMRNS